MASQVKRFGEHSQRWQKQAKAQGITPAKWNKWRRLSPSTRRITNPTDYAKGKTVAVFRSEKKNQAVFDSLNNIFKSREKYRPRTVKARIFGGLDSRGDPIETMTERQKDKVLSFKSSGALSAWIEKQLAMVSRSDGSDSVWFYQ